MADIVLEISHLSKKFRRGEMHDALRDLLPAVVSGIFKREKKPFLDKDEFWAVNDVSFQVAKGESFGIIGSNGAGKSTILKLLTGVMKPTNGTITVKGVMSALIEVGAGFHQDLTGRENIFLNGTILGMRKEQIVKKFDEIVQFSGLEEFIDTPVKRYSSGMYARLGFSVAAHVDPDILIVDEVLSVGDYSFQNKCHEKMKSIMNSGTTVLFVSHNLRAVTEICNRCVLLEHGSILKEGPPEEVVDYYLHGDADGRSRVEADEAYISKVAFHGRNGRTLRFEPGERVVFEIEVTGKVDCAKLSVGLSVMGSDNYEVFNTATQRLNLEPFDLAEGETRRVVFELDLHLARGTYHIYTYIYRYDIQKMYDQYASAGTFYVSSDTDIYGVANLYPTARIE